MSTRGFVGFKKDSSIRGWYNHFDSYYSELGVNVLEKFKKHNDKELKDFFNNVKLISNDIQDKYYSNHKIVFDMNWEEVQEVTLQDGTDFLDDGLFCEYGYVFDLDNNTLDVYRGFFKEAQDEHQEGVVAYDGTVYYTNKVLTVDRNNIELAEVIFKNESSIYEQLEDYSYWEQEYLSQQR